MNKPTAVIYTKSGSIRIQLQDTEADTLNNISASGPLAEAMQSQLAKQLLERAGLDESNVNLVQYH